MIVTVMGYHFARCALCSAAKAATMIFLEKPPVVLLNLIEHNLIGMR